MMTVEELKDLYDRLREDAWLDEKIRAAKRAKEEADDLISDAIYGVLNPGPDNLCPEHRALLVGLAKEELERLAARLADELF